jgi:4-methylaminobutanoate oxidase (formaldehyde-forming)
MYGHSIGSCLGMGYIENPEGVNKEWIESQKFEIEVAGERYPAEASLKAFYDPGNARIRM